MRIKNHTDIPTETVRKIIQFVRPPAIKNFDVRVSNHSRRGSRGRAYGYGSGYHDRACPFVVVSIAKTDRLAQEIRKGKEMGRGYLPHNIGSRLEALIFVMAHELRHLWQAKIEKGWRVYGSRGQFSERDADAYAIQKLRVFRRSATLTTQ